MFVRYSFIALIACFLISCKDELKSKHETLKEGMLRAEAEQIMGSPVKESKEFRLPQKEGFEAEYEAAVMSRSVLYLYWKKTFGRTYVAGFDSSGKVVFKSSGRQWKERDKEKEE